MQIGEAFLMGNYFIAFMVICFRLKLFDIQVVKHLSLPSETNTSRLAA